MQDEETIQLTPEQQLQLELIERMPYMIEKSDQDDVDAKPGEDKDKIIGINLDLCICISLVLFDVNLVLSCFRLEQRPCELIERPTNERQIPDPDDEDTLSGDETPGGETCHGSSIWCFFAVAVVYLL